MFADFLREMRHYYLIDNVTGDFRDDDLQWMSCGKIP